MTVDDFSESLNLAASTEPTMSDEIKKDNKLDQRHIAFTLSRIPRPCRRSDSPYCESHSSSYDDRVFLLHLLKDIEQLVAARRHQPL